MDNLPKSVLFPKTIDIKKWKEYLGRDLTLKERIIISEKRSENYMNKDMNRLYNICEKDGLYIPLLTDLDGNCLFQSLNYFGIGDSVEELREAIAHLMYVLKDYKNLLPGVDLTLQEMHDFGNDVECVSTIVKGHPTKKRMFFKYTFNVMCQDLANKYSWSKLPTELIMRFMSFMFNLKFEIYHNRSGHITIINANEDDCKHELMPIKLGLIGESHYVPIDVLGKDEVINQLSYKEATIKFINWAHQMQKEVILKYLQQYNEQTDIEKEPIDDLEQKTE